MRVVSGPSGQTGVIGPIAAEETDVSDHERRAETQMQIVGSPPGGMANHKTTHPSWTSMDKVPESKHKKAENGYKGSLFLG